MTQPPEQSEAQSLEARLRSLPESPGVYIFRDEREQVIYVGKAVNLRNRVRSYFATGSDGRIFYEVLTKNIADVSHMVTDTEKEALILENNLIKQFKPRYNVRLTDDASYICLKIDLSEEFPRVQLPSGRERAKASKVLRDGADERNALWFGPYSSSTKARETLREINRMFPLRKCSSAQFERRNRPCIHRQMGRCLGPCAGHVKTGEYNDVLEEVIMVLNGKYDKLREVLTERMNREAGRLHYERAAELRDRLAAIETTFEKQKVSVVGGVDRDIFGLYRDAKALEIGAMFVRDGMLGELDSYNFPLDHFTPEEVFDSFVTQFYAKQQRFIPREVLVPCRIEDAEPLAEMLTEKKGRKVSVLRPQRGEKARLIELASRNAETAFKARVSQDERNEDMLQSLKQKLGLRNVPRRVECFDISNFQGHLAVGSMVSFLDGKPDKQSYRKFKIRTVTQSDDFAMMREVISRRYDKRRDADGPDLVVVDGGKGQLSSAVSIFRELGIDDVDLIGLAKSRSKKGRRSRSKTPERVFRPGDSAAVVLPKSSPELFFLMRVRDEAHRFAISYHRLLRKKRLAYHPLDGIPGIGDVKKKRLLERFGDYKSIRNADIEQLRQVKGISQKNAEAVRRRLNADGKRSDGD